jgi:isopentenyl diphosphate isomerase/L-lactate dehydrogenase-like FMN-dependent dehydrogenase
LTEVQGAIRSKLDSVEDYEHEARRRMDQSLIDYVYRGTESQSTLRRNEEYFGRFLLRRRVLQGIESVDLHVSYFDGRIESDLPFFPAPTNCTPFYAGALKDLLNFSNDFAIPIFISHIAMTPPLEVAQIPALIKNRSCAPIWQIYMQSNNMESCLKQARLAESWGYKALTITVDTELNVKLGNEIVPQTAIHSFVKISPKEVRELRSSTSLPLIVKGLMTAEDAELAIELGADGIVVSNHGARTLDHAQSTLEVLPEIVKHLRSKKKTREAEVFVDGGIRRGTDILIALALGASGCLVGRPVLWGFAVDHEHGPANVLRILKGELERAAVLCGVSKISKVKKSIVKYAD